jgi:hypothetical protein
MELHVEDYEQYPMPAQELLDPHPQTVTGRTPWTEQEDIQLNSLVELHGSKAWTKIASVLVGRTSKQCRERWINRVNPELNITPWTPEELDILTSAYEEMGSKWSRIEQRLPGRSANGIKNCWNSLMRKRERHDHGFKKRGRPTRGDESDNGGAAGGSSSADDAEKPLALSVTAAAPVKSESAAAAAGGEEVSALHSIAVQMALFLIVFFTFYRQLEKPMARRSERDGRRRRNNNSMLTITVLCVQLLLCRCAVSLFCHFVTRQSGVPGSSAVSSLNI